MHDQFFIVYTLKPPSTSTHATPIQPSIQGRWHYGNCKDLSHDNTTQIITTTTTGAAAAGATQNME